MKEATIYLTKRGDLLPVELKCPQCQHKYLRGAPYVVVPCHNCSIVYKTDFRISMFRKSAGRVQDTLAWHDKVTFIAEKEYYKDLIRIERNHRYMGMWDVSIMETYSEEYWYCEQCGICLDCFTCKKCGKTFNRDINRRKVRCPSCKSSSFTSTQFQEVIKSDKNRSIRLCPHCKSDNIKMTLTKQKTKCHVCGSKQLSETMHQKYYKLIIQRKKAYYLDNLKKTNI